MGRPRGISYGVLIAAFAIGGSASAQRPSVTSVSHSTVELEPGGRPVRVEYRGRGLTGFRSAVVESSGRAVRGVTVRVSFDRTRGSGSISIVADASVAPMKGTLFLVSRSGRLEIPGLAVVVAAAEQPGLSRLSVDRPTVGEGEQFTVSATLDRPAGRNGAEVLLTYPPSIDGPATIRIRGGTRTGSVRMNVLDVSEDLETQIVGHLGQDRSRVAVTVIDNSFQPLGFTVTPLTMVGVRFEPRTFSVVPLTFVGVRFEPRTFSVVPLTVRGVRFQPQTITTPTVTVVGIGGDDE